jgi:4-hydroxy-tetrahydrodipicolinate synthase
MFRGLGTALVTPFRRDFSLDEAALRFLIKRQLKAGVDFLVPCGTTGESPSLTHDEKRRVIEIALEESSGRVPVIAGAGGYNTAEVIHAAREYESLGANGILSVTPYYNKPSQEGLYQHFKAIAASVKIPVILYNVPGRTGVNLEPATVARLAQIDNITGIKEASGNISQMSQLFQVVPDDFAVLSGDDAITLPLAALGGVGVISVVSNEVPAEMASLVHDTLNRNFTRARETHGQYLPLMEINFVESNPGPVKSALAMMGLIEPVWRLPLVSPNTQNLAKIRSVLDSLHLVETAHVAIAS